MSVQIIRFRGRRPIVAAMGSLIRLMAVAFSAIVLLGFAFFATDEMSRGSQNQQNALEGELSSTNSREDSDLSASRDLPPVAPSPQEEAHREKVNGTFREAVEDANDVLLGPFAGLVESADNTWVLHGVPVLLGLLLYGFGLGMLARMLPKHREHGADWRAAA
jgi:uncharacterized BrkB/YihY/UPF0761 family membrane protein